ncbi:hypothetical protein DL766_001494 [Monosporascus sp. MC13-8B]|uniref:Prion-inhibition and propagation HeLo domain-containing protein n=1 Tax=Monosporascus cannonballus TaxID=155416 RepID=A0ABY0H750_9PEZI|nr:hypothetical protein DL762_006258 [Monosporascus cannonballus]RYO99831.1 hypothetical protein DL763_001221 [Monosporascus cannonballus]RYP37500.1 hypothetical protein DL766_001494 [Monosporascus sp. MC13-8B]
MAPLPGISEGWEELVDDAFSVISVSTSDDFDDDRQSSSNECLIPASASTNPTVGQCSVPGSDINGLPIRAKPPGAIASDANRDGSKALGGDVQDDQAELHGMDTKNVAEPEETSSQSLYRGLDWDNVDPTFLLKIDTSLIKLITQITDLLDFKSNFNLPNGALSVKYRCQKLLGYLQQLSPILEGYSKHWDPRHATGNIPLDPGLKTWMLKLRIELLSLEDKLQKYNNQQALSTEVARGLRSRVPDMSEYDKPLDASNYAEILATFSAQIEELMPILETLNGGLTYAEFCELNPDIVRSLSLRLKEIADNLFLESRKVQSLRDMDKPDNAEDLDEPPTQAISELSLNQLYNMEEVLQSVLRLRRPPISSEEET